MISPQNAMTATVMFILVGCGILGNPYKILASKWQTPAAVDGEGPKVGPRCSFDRVGHGQHVHTIPRFCWYLASPNLGGGSASGRFQSGRFGSFLVTWWPIFNHPAATEPRAKDLLDGGAKEAMWLGGMGLVWSASVLDNLDLAESCRIMLPMPQLWVDLCQFFGAFLSARLVATTETHSTASLHGIPSH